MYEDKEEALHRLFPEGYAIVYIQKNNDPALHWHNPKEDQFIETYVDFILGVAELGGTLEEDSEGGVLSAEDFDDDEENLEEE